MKNALLLSLALIAVGPVAVEGQAEDLALANRLLQARTCEMVDMPSGAVERCIYRLPGLEFSVSELSESGTVRITKLDASFNGALSFAPGIRLQGGEFMGIQNTTGTAIICLGAENTARFVTSTTDCYDNS